MAPDAEGAMRKIPDDVRAEEGRALARLGDGGWDPLVQAGRARGALRRRARRRGRRGRAGLGRRRCGWVAAIPSQRSGELVPGFARALAERLGLPFAPVLAARRPTRPPQREMANSHQQVANVRGAFAVTGAPPPGAGLLVDDIRFSGWTLAMVAGQLRGKGAEAVYPLALSTAF